MSVYSRILTGCATVSLTALLFAFNHAEKVTQNFCLRIVNIDCMLQELNELLKKRNRLAELTGLLCRAESKGFGVKRELKQVLKLYRKVLDKVALKKLSYIQYVKDLNDKVTNYSSLLGLIYPIERLRKKLDWQVKLANRLEQTSTSLQRDNIGDYFPPISSRSTSPSLSVSGSDSDTSESLRYTVPFPEVPQEPASVDQPEPLLDEIDEHPEKCADLEVTEPCPRSPSSSPFVGTAGLPEPYNNDASCVPLSSVVPARKFDATSSAEFPTVTPIKAVELFIKDMVWCSVVSELNCEISMEVVPHTRNSSRSISPYSLPSSRTSPFTELLELADPRQESSPFTEDFLENPIQTLSPEALSLGSSKITGVAGTSEPSEVLEPSVWPSPCNVQILEVAEVVKFTETCSRPSSTVSHVPSPFTEIVGSSEPLSFEESGSRPPSSMSTCSSKFSEISLPPSLSEESGVNSDPCELQPCGALPSSVVPAPKLYIDSSMEFTKIIPNKPLEIFIKDFVWWSLVSKLKEMNFWASTEVSPCSSPFVEIVPLSQCSSKSSSPYSLPSSRTSPFTEFVELADPCQESSPFTEVVLENSMQLSSSPAVLSLSSSSITEVAGPSKVPEPCVDSCDLQCPSSKRENTEVIGVSKSTELCLGPQSSASHSSPPFTKVSGSTEPLSSAEDCSRPPSSISTCSSPFSEISLPASLSEESGVNSDPWELQPCGVPSSSVVPATKLCIDSSTEYTKMIHNEPLEIFIKDLVWWSLVSKLNEMNFRASTKVSPCSSPFVEIVPLSEDSSMSISPYSLPSSRTSPFTEFVELADPRQESSPFTEIILENFMQSSSPAVLSLSSSPVTEVAGPSEPSKVPEPCVGSCDLQCPSSNREIGEVVGVSKGTELRLSPQSTASHSSSPFTKIAGYSEPLSSAEDSSRPPSSISTCSSPFYEISLPASLSEGSGVNSDDWEFLSCGSRNE